MADIIRIDENTWRIEDGFVRFFLLEGEEKAVMIDSGVGCPDAADMAKRLTEKKIMLLNTHGDGDHTSGTGKFPEIHIHLQDYNNCGLASAYPQTVPVQINDGDVMELGNRPLKLIHIPGHTYGSVAVLDIKKRVLFAGDSVQKGHIYMFGDKREPEKFAESLEKLAAMKSEYDYIYASHDEFCLPADYCEKVLEAWKSVRKSDVSYEMINLFGNDVRSYTTEVCGFYL